MRFKDQVVVVTGAARGIGFQAALQFAQEGAKVVVNDLDPGAVDAAVEKIKAQGGVAIGVPGDVSDEQQVHANVEQILGEMKHIDVLVNNAGLYTLAPTATVTSKDWRRILSVNVDGAFFWAQTVGSKSMIPRRSGVIINIASGAGLQGIPHAAAYVTSKHALIGLTKSLAVDWGQYNIRVNAVCPALTWTEMAKSGRDKYPDMFVERQRRIPLGRACEVEEQADAILFMASPQAKSVHGHIFVVDGGVAAMSSGYAVPRDDT